MNRPEQKLQRQIADFLRLAYPKLLWWHTPNGGSRNAVEAAIFKSMGVLAGVPDLTFVLPQGRVAFMEVKADRGQLSDSQKAFAQRCVELGAAWCVVRSPEEVNQHLKAWGV